VDGTGRGRGGDETPPFHAPLIHISGYPLAIALLCAASCNAVSVFFSCT